MYLPFCKAELASSILVSKNPSKMLPDDFLEEADEEREFATLNQADEVEKGILENRVAYKGTCFAVTECCTDIVLDASAFSDLFLAYEDFLTFSFTQICFERALRKPKQVKRCLRLTLVNEKLHVFMWIGCEKRSPGIFFSR